MSDLKQTIAKQADNVLSRNDKVNTSLTNLDRSPYRKSQLDTSVSGANKSVYDTASSNNRSVLKGGKF